MLMYHKSVLSDYLWLKGTMWTTLVHTVVPMYVPLQQIHPHVLIYSPFKHSVHTRAQFVPLVLHSSPTQTIGQYWLCLPA